RAPGTKRLPVRERNRHPSRRHRARPEQRQLGNLVELHAQSRQRRLAILINSARPCFRTFSAGGETRAPPPNSQTQPTRTCLMNSWARWGSLSSSSPVSHVNVHSRARSQPRQWGNTALSRVHAISPALGSGGEVKPTAVPGTRFSRVAGRGA